MVYLNNAKFHEVEVSDQHIHFILTLQIRLSQPNNNAVHCSRSGDHWQLASQVADDFRDRPAHQPAGHQ